MRIQFTVPAVPVAQPRPRAIARNGRGCSVPPPKSHPIHDFKASVRQSFAALHGFLPPFQGALAMHLVFVMPRPQSLVCKTRPMPRVPYVASKNDWDNLGKGVCDALLQLAYHDDGQIVRAVVERWTAAGDEQPHVEVTIEEVATA